MVVPDKIGYQYVCIRSNGVLDSHSIIFDTLEEAVKIAKGKQYAEYVIDGEPDIFFIVGKYATYYWNGKKASAKDSEKHYALLEDIEHGQSYSYTVLWPSGHVFDRCPIRKSTARYEAVVIQYPMNGLEPICLGVSKAKCLEEAKMKLKEHAFEPLDDGPVFKAIIFNPSQIPYAEPLTVTIKEEVFDKNGNEASKELTESVKGIRYHPTAAEKEKSTCCLI